MKAFSGKVISTSSTLICREGLHKAFSTAIALRSSLLTLLVGEVSSSEVPAPAGDFKSSPLSLAVSPGSAVSSKDSREVSRPLPDETSKLADDPEVTKREMRMIQRESRKVGRSEGRKVLGALMMLNRAQGRISL